MAGYARNLHSGDSALYGMSLVLHLLPHIYAAAFAQDLHNPPTCRLSFRLQRDAVANCKPDQREFRMPRGHSLSAPVSVRSASSSYARHGSACTKCSAAACPFRCDVSGEVMPARRKGVRRASKVRLMPPLLACRDDACSECCVLSVS